MKTIKYLLIAAAAYYLYKKISDNKYQNPGTGDGDTRQPQNPPMLEAVQGVKSLPYTY
jgi:hypothetical protein